jgi:GT2 family glycosyltransferase
MEESTVKAPDVSIVILNFNTLNLTRMCLESLAKSRLGHYKMEVIICDNASTDGTETMVKKEFPQVIIIQNGKNVGFAAGNNPGIRESKGRFVLLLNSDSEVTPTAIATMITFMDAHPEAGAATCKLVLPNGVMDPACHRGFPTPWAAITYVTKMEKILPHTNLFGQYHQGYKNLEIAHQVDAISGAFFMVRREVVHSVGLLDEDYFMYAEDIDWAFRIKKAGWEIWFNPAATGLHKKKQSGRASAVSKRRIKSELYFHKNNWLFYKKNYTDTYPPFISFMVNSFYSIRIWLLENLSI